MWFLVMGFIIFAGDDVNTSLTVKIIKQNHIIYNYIVT